MKVWFPSMYMKLISVKMQKTPPQALLHIPPSMTKWEVREYLTKIYGVSVINVDTANFLGLSYLISLYGFLILTTNFANALREVEEVIREEEGNIIQEEEL